MGKRLLLEDTIGEFTPALISVQESTSTNGSRPFLKIAGRLSLCDTLNGNNRIYPRSVWEKQFASGSRLMSLIERNASVGLLEHPKDGQVSLQSPISHLLVSAKLQEDGEVHGELLIVNTPEGQKLKALIEAGYRPLVSSRGYGSLEKDSSGRDIVQDDYVCEGWDTVFHPSFTQCELEAVSQPENKSGVTESVGKVTPKEDSASLKPIVESGISGVGPAKPAHVEAASKASNPSITYTMDAIRTKLGSIAALEPAKMGPQQLAETRNQLRGLHNDTAKWLAEDASRSYEAEQLHKAVNEVESRWDQAITQPRAESARLITERQKTLSVLSATVETAKTLKTKLSEALAANAKLAAVNAKLLEAVRAWRAEASTIKSKVSLVERKYDLACESLDIVADRWRNDTTSLGRAKVELEYSEALKTNKEAKTKLDEATHPDDVADVREQLLGESKKASLSESKSPGAKPVTESKQSEQKAPVTEDRQTLIQPRVVQIARNPGSLKESVAIARRLSGRQLTESAKTAA